MLITDNEEQFSTQDEFFEKYPEYNDDVFGKCEHCGNYDLDDVGVCKNEDLNFEVSDVICNRWKRKNKMYIYEITNGFTGTSYVRCYVILQFDNPDHALEIANIKHPGNNFKIMNAVEAWSGYCSKLSDEGLW